MQTEYIDHIDHRAMVKEIDKTNGIVTLQILDETGECGTCPASKLCHGASKDHLVTATRHDVASLHVGDVVTVRGSERLHRKAIMLATVLPCIALIAVMVLIYLLSGNQLAAALGGLGATVFFFALIWLMRGRIAHEFEFDIIRG